jgi:hypothetical protein
VCAPGIDPIDKLPSVNPVHRTHAKDNITGEDDTKWRSILATKPKVLYVTGESVRKIDTSLHQYWLAKHDELDGVFLR